MLVNGQVVMYSPLPIYGISLAGDTWTPSRMQNPLRFSGFYVNCYVPLLTSLCVV